MMEPKETHQGVFSVEIYLRLRCPGCGNVVKRRVVDYLTTRTSNCPNCSAKMVHLARGRTTKNTQLDLNQLKEFIGELEGQWTALVNESLMMESTGFDIEPGAS
ncbi:MAG: hypothetical protein KIS61_08345 [Candidatus Eremiobacteraeota bacterium]|nr:hypothetical protein [Candidatus Eremiobacteraeota bacterium]